MPKTGRKSKAQTKGNKSKDQMGDNKEADKEVNVSFFSAVGMLDISCHCAETRTNNARMNGQ